MAKKTPNFGCLIIGPREIDEARELRTSNTKRDRKEFVDYYRPRPGSTSSVIAEQLSVHFLMRIINNSLSSFAFASIL